ncbi:unnamed protein product [Urochloa decumbens]|uniref:Disease resistance protein RPM1 n=1 Tax=Urochloa decumbens TaxID=240449 RepID=A0ABC8VHJ4_9POAL
MEATALSIGKSVLSGALGYAKSAVAEEVALQLGISRDQAFIKDELEMMLSFLMAAHEEQDKHEVRETWVRQIRAVAYDVEDSLMDFAVRVRKQPWWRTLLDRRHVAKQMKDLRAKVEDVSQRNLRYRLIDGGSTSKAANAADSAVTAAAMFGINEARYAAKKEQSRLDLTQLINKEGDGDLGVIAVWGTSGNVGHTSIIWEAYESSATQNNFPCRAWVRVMHPFSPIEFIRSLLDEFRPAAGVDSSLIETEKTGQALVDELHGYVNGKRCLIVLSNLSTIEEWNRVFKKTVDLNKEYPELVEPAKFILNKCNGLPLAIVTIGSFLAGQESISAMEWRRLNEHITAELEMNPKMDLIRSVLMKSYDGLPYYLKPCFLYMSIFPEDCNIRRRRLVRRWAVEGYSAEARDKSFMEIADGYFEELIGRSMVLPTQESITSKQKADSCKLHDLIRDISISMSMKENLVFRLEDGCISNTHGAVRHLAISSNWEGDEGEFQSIVELSCIRSLTVFGKWKPFYISDKIRFLRVLDLEGTEDLANHCLENIGKLLHLRYLSLRMCFGIFCLPDSVGNLSQLEVLDIKRTEIQVLPKTIIRLRKLRYLHAGSGGFCIHTSGLSNPEKCMELLKVQRDACFGKFRKIYTRRRMRDWCAIACCAALPPIMTSMKFSDDHGVTVPKGMDKLKSLHTLRYVHLAWGNAVVEEIKGLTGLRKLGVVGISEKNCQNLRLAISKLSLLESLSLSSDLDFSVFLSDVNPPPENLKSLKLFGKMAELPEWIKGLQNLVKLRLIATDLTSSGAAMLLQDIGKLRNLSILSLAEHAGYDPGYDITVGQIKFKSGLFMSLKVLDLTYPPGTEFKSVKFDNEAMPKLEVLHLRIGQTVSFCGVQHLQSIKEIRVSHSYNDTPDERKQSFFRELREQLDKEKMGHLLKLV